MQVLRSKDFNHIGSTGQTLNAQKEDAINPCDGCTHRQRCAAHFLSCDRYRGYQRAKSYYVQPEKYMAKPNIPSRAAYVDMFGDDDLPEAPPLPSVGAAELVEAIEAVKSAEYPKEAEHDVRLRVVVGRYVEWKAKQTDLLEELRSQLRALQV